MVNHNLLTLIQPQRVVNATAAGTTAVNGTAVDMADFGGVVFVVLLGTLTSTTVPSVKVQQSDDSGSSDDWTDLASSSVAGTDADGNKMLIVEVRSPLKRYVRIVITRATANTVVDGAIALPYSPTFAPPAIHSTQIGTTKKILNQPAEGTA